MKKVQKVHLAYAENKDSGLFAYEVTLYAGLHPIEIFDGGKTSLRHILLTEKTPRQVLRKLEKAASKAGGENPSARDRLIGPHDLDPEYAEMQRWASYQGMGGWPQIGETQERVEERARECKISRNTKLLQAYQEFIKRVHAKPEPGKNPVS